MNELPELPFKKVLSYLSLEDRLRSKAVSRRWYWTIDSIQVKNLCYSERPAGFIKGKGRLISGSLGQNFIYSPRFVSFFNASRRSTFSNLKHLRLCYLKVDIEKRKAFASVLRSLGQLEQLDIIQLNYHNNFGRPNFGPQKEFKLHFPMLTGLWIDGSIGFGKLKLDAPRLQKVRVRFEGVQRLELVHSESVEWLMVSGWTAKAVEEMKNLKYLYLTGDPKEFEPSLLPSLQQLREIHLHDRNELSKIFKQKQRYALADLKIFYFGLLLTRPDDPAIRSLKPVLLPDGREIWAPLFGYLSDKAIDCLAENSSRLADEIPFYEGLFYSAVESVAPELQMSLLKKFTHLRRIKVHVPVEDTERFLVILKNLDTIEHLEFQGKQPQELFDRLPEHCSVQKLTFWKHWDFDVRFLFRLEHLIELSVDFLIDAEFLCTIFENLKFLSSFSFYYLNNPTVVTQIKHPERFYAKVFRSYTREFSDLDAVIDFLSDPYSDEDEKRFWKRTPLTYTDQVAEEFLDQFDSVLHVKRLL